MSLHGPARLLDLGAVAVGTIGLAMLGLAHWLIGDDEPNDVLADVLIRGDETGLT